MAGNPESLQQMEKKIEQLQQEILQVKLQKILARKTRRGHGKAHANSTDQAQGKSLAQQVNTMFNLSSHELTTNELSVLNKGFNFVPTYMALLQLICVDSLEL